eukprot:gene8858-18353_t
MFNRLSVERFLIVLIIFNMGLQRLSVVMGTYPNFKLKIYRGFKLQSQAMNDGINKFGPSQLTCISFFKFFPISNPPDLVQSASRLIGDFKVKGTLYVAPEGVNGQFAVPSMKLDEFRGILGQLHVELHGVDLNIGRTVHVSDESQLPFRKLLIKTRKQVLTDGLPEKLDLNDAGPEVDAQNWHNELSQDNNVILLDCRNDYEYEYGTFQNAKPLNTTIFSQTWEQLDDTLRELPKDQRILTFCTGGIRCVKVNAYLKQRLGFNNIGRLKKGIIAYEEWINDDTESSGSSQMEAEKNAKQSLFQGKNFLFDRRRLIETIDGEDVVTE